MSRNGRGARRRPAQRQQRCTVGDVSITTQNKQQMVEKLEALGEEARRTKNDVAAESFFQAAEHFKKGESDV